MSSASHRTVEHVLVLIPNFIFIGSHFGLTASNFIFLLGAKG